jgi:hypothetical protein
MDFLKLHINGEPALFRVDLINGVLPLKAFQPALKGKGCYIVCGDDELSRQVDEPFDEVLEAICTYDVEIFEGANDSSDD